MRASYISVKVKADPLFSGFAPMLLMAIFARMMNGQNIHISSVSLFTQVYFFSNFKDFNTIAPAR